MGSGEEAAMAGRIVGRDAEQEVVAQFLSGLAAGPGALVIRGDPGIGKSVLWRAGCEEARRRSIRTLVSRPSEAEAAMSFAALADLLSAEVDDAQRVLPPVQAAALRTALGQLAPQDPRPHPNAIGLGLLGVLGTLAERSPVLIAIDDAQWLDRPSARMLGFALRRLTREPVGVLATERTAATAKPRLDLHRSFPDGRCVICSPGPLTLGALHRLLREHLGVAFPRTTLLRVHRASAGNPLWALELARALGPDAGPLPPSGLLPVPTDLSRLLGRRLAALSAGPREALLAAAQLASPTPGLIASALGDHDRAAAALLAAERAGIIDIDGDGIAFTHPLLASVLVGRASPATRSALHLRLAETVTDPEERARHLAMGTDSPDERVASTVSAAAAVAAARGAPSSAAELLELSSALTPPGLAAERARRLTGAAGHYFRSGDAERARMLLEQVVDLLSAGEARANALRLLGLVRCHTDSFRAAHDLFGQALLETGGNLGLRAALQLQASYCGLIFGDAAGAASLAEDALAIAERLSDPVLLAGALGWAAFFDFLTGGGFPARRLQRALATSRAGTAGPAEPALEPRLLAGTVMKWAGHFDQARDLLLGLQAQAAQTGDDSMLPYLLCQMAELECWAGDWGRAARCAERSDELAAESGQQILRAITLHARGLVAAHRGQTGEARALLGEGLALAQGDACNAFAQLNRSALGFLELSLGDCAAARCQLAELIEQVTRYGVAEPAVVRWVPDAVEALIGDGDLMTAEAVLAPFESRAQALEGGWALAAAARCRGLLSAAGGDTEAGIDHLGRALRLAENLAQPFELARCLFVHGRLLRRARQKRLAEASLVRSRDLFDELGAGLWSGRASEELGRVGLRRSQTGVLTPGEERVAGLAAEGLTNREVAERLFMSPKTVDATLARVYRKLGVRSRTELASHRGPGA
jgi:DNA-binding CsgD family transcriptional regulator